MTASDTVPNADIYKAINHAELFAGIGAPEQHALASKLSIIHSNANEIIIEQGDVSDSLYMIFKGYVSVYIKRTDGWVRINRLGPGDVFGEIGVLRKIRRTARIVTEGPCVFFSINSTDFLDIYQHFPARARDNIQIIIAKRMAHQSHSTD